MITYIKGYLKEQLNYAELMVLGSCLAFGDEPLRAELSLLSSGKSLDDGLHYAETVIVTNS